MCAVQNTNPEKCFLVRNPIYQTTSCSSSAPSEAPAKIGGKALSATEAIVWWLPLPQSNLDGYQVSRRIPAYVILKLKTELCVDDAVFASYELLSSYSCPCTFPGEVLEDSRGQWGSGEVGGGAQQGEPYQAGWYVAKLQLPHWGSGLQLCRLRATQRAAADPHQEIPYVVPLEPLTSSLQLHHPFLIIVAFLFCFFCHLPAPKKAPRIIGQKLKAGKINIAWEADSPESDEATIDGYKVSAVLFFLSDKLWPDLLSLIH